jgi:homoserine dehydrogenase
MKNINIILFGTGNVGGTLINQIQKAIAKIEKEQHISLKLQLIANSTKALYQDISKVENWEDVFVAKGKPYTITDIVDYINSTSWEDIIAIDATASKDFVGNYALLIQSGCHIVTANKIANTLDYEFYNQLRQLLKNHNKRFKYETNVGAGLPIIDTIRSLHDAGENITRIRGVFSGSLSYIFNTFSEKNLPFSEIVKTAMEKGYTEPDPREDLNGNDVARKLLILARELDLKNEFEDISIQNLIPKHLQDISKTEFLSQISSLDVYFQSIKSKLDKGEVLRYVGDLYGDLFQEKGQMKVSLVAVPRESPLGSLKGSDALIEIFTDSYTEQPLVIQGAGAGAAVTARGVFVDALRLSKAN